MKDYLSRLQELPAVVRELKRGSLATRLTILAAVSFFVSAVLASDLVPKELKEQLGPLRLPSWFFGIAVALVLWLVVILFRIVPPLPSSEHKLPTDAIKGPGSFGPQDGSLFSRLGRGDEVATLRGYVLDDQVGLVAVMGESGAGKTSLLRSGLHYQLEQRQPTMPYVYWEALPTNPVSGLLHAVGGYLEPGERVPSNLEELLAWAEQEKGVVVLDQLEQLDPQDEAHAPIFGFLRRLGHRLPPYRSTWIVAFRREFDPVWRDFELENFNLRARMFSLKLFPRERAKAVMATLGETVHLSFEDALLEDMLRAASKSGPISPVDVGIGMLVLSELAQKLDRDTLTKNDYRFAGGAEGLLTGYIVKSLSRIGDSERSAMLNGLLKLVDLRTGRREAEGHTLDEIAAASGLPVGRVKTYVDLLAEARLLETLGQRRVRLLHDRIVTPLRRLAGSILAERDTALITLEEGLRRWRESDGRWGLLTGLELKLVWRNREDIVDGTAEEMEYLRQSRNLRLRRRALAAGVAMLVVASPFLGSLYKERVDLEATRQVRNRVVLSELGLPRDLYDRLGQLQGLRVSLGDQHDDIPNLEWLDRATALTTLDLRGTRVASLKGLPQTVTTLMLSAGSRLTPPPVPEIPSTVRNLTLQGRFDSPLRLPRSLDSLTVSVYDGAALPDLGHLPSSLRTIAVSLYRLEVLSPESSRTPDVPGAVPWVYSKLGRAGSLTIGELDSSTARADLSGLPASVKTLALNLWSPGTVELPSLPATIESLALVLRHDRPELFDRLPSNVTFLLLAFRDQSDLDAALARVPVVRSLALFGVPEGLDLRLPPSVDWLYLTLDSAPAETCSRLFRSLPPSVRHLKLQLVTPKSIAALSDLPRSIQFLALQWDAEYMSELPVLSPRVDSVDITRTKITSLKGARAAFSQLILRPSQMKSLDGLPDSVKILQFRSRTDLNYPLTAEDDYLERMLEAAGPSGGARIKPGAGAAAQAPH